MRSTLRLTAPSWGLLPTLALALVCVLGLPAGAQPKGKGRKVPAATADKTEKAEAPADDKTGGDKLGGDKAGKGGKGPTKTFDFNALDLNGRMRTPQLLYFLERANEELERASLEKRSFIPHMVRSLEEEQL